MHVAVLCLCPCVTQGVYFPPNRKGGLLPSQQEAEYSFSGFIYSNKHTNKQTNKQTNKIEATPALLDPSFVWFEPLSRTKQNTPKVQVPAAGLVAGVWLIIALITWKSNLFLFLDGPCTSNPSPCRFGFSVFWVFAGIEPTTSGLIVLRSDQLS